MLTRKIKQLVVFISILLVAAPLFAAWTLKPSQVSKAGHYIYWQIICTSDGSALSATNILSSTYMDETLLREIQGTSMLIMDIIPGTGGVIPNVDIDIAWANSKVTFYDQTGFSKDADTVGNKLNKDYHQFPPILGQLKLTLNDIGDSGDQVTLVILCWIEDK